jgi:tRNA (Thr-GGU) A37 N-methylase
MAGFSESHKSEWSATVAPPRLGGKKRMGVFATRSPYRPNPLGLSSVRLESVELDEKLGAVLNVTGIDMIDNTPIYDIKPYLAYADSHPDAIGGFASEVLGHHLKVVIPESVEKLIAQKERDNIIGLLSQDPRSAYIHDEERVWGIYYGGKNIRFKVVGDVLTVTDIENM